MLLANSLNFSSLSAIVFSLLILIIVEEILFASVSKILISSSVQIRSVLQSSNPIKPKKYLCQKEELLI